MTIDAEKFSLAANTIRTLSADAVEKAKSGHPGMPMGMADCGAVLWLRHLRFNPQDPKWLNRDRFILSNGHGSMFLYSLLHLSGYALSMEELKAFRQWDSNTPGHPESFMTPGVECTTGPLGQGISNAVGTAIASKALAARYNTSSETIFDNKVFVFCGDGCLMEGVSGEASSVAGHLGLSNLIVVYDDNKISIAGHTNLAFTEDVAKRYEGYGWRTEHVDGHDFNAVDAAISAAKDEAERPTLILASTVIGKGSPNKANTHGVHGAALGEEELRATKRNLNWPEDKEFFVPEEVRAVFAARVEELQSEYKSWQEKFSKWSSGNPEKSKALEAQTTRAVPADLSEKLIASLPEPNGAVATRKLSGIVLQEASKQVPALIGGSADLEPSTLTLIKDSDDIQKGEFTGLNMRFGVREHGMGAIMNGLSYDGNFIPYGSTFLCFSDYMRPAVRLAALSHLPGLFIYTHESIFLGEDGPTHQPVEHVASLRLIPNLWVMRPADGVETAVCYAMALARKDGPAALCFTRQGIEPCEKPTSFSPADIEKGAYLVYESAPEPEVTFVATGSELPLAVSAAKALSQKTRVVSMPCADVFLEQEKSFRESLIPPSSKKVTIEAGVTTGWVDTVGGATGDTLCVGVDRFGASAPYKDLVEHFGFTPESVVKRVKEKFSI